MPKFKPFKAIRPPRDKAHLVASRSYITYTKSELMDKLNGNPYTFLHLINPEASLGLITTKNSDNRFHLVKERFDEWMALGYLKADSQPGFYIYRQTQANHVFTGIFGCTSVDDYEKGLIKIHENTLTDREQIFVNYLDATEFHAEPVLLTYPDNPSINQMVERYTQTREDYDFSTTDTIRHQLWPIWDAKDLAQLEQHFAKVPAFYIADGHHRSASSFKLALKRKQAGQAINKDSATSYFMSCLIPESQMHIEPFHRLVTDLNGLSPQDLLTKLKTDFDVEAVTDGIEAAPQARHQFSMFVGNRWYKLKLKNIPSAKTSPVERLDPHIITETVLSPILGIKDLKTDQRISCIGGKEGFVSIENLVNSSKFAVGFWLYPTSIAEVKEIADKHLVMPPKSTWVEPKLRSGLTVFSFAAGEKI